MKHTNNLKLKWVSKAKAYDINKLKEVHVMGMDGTGLSVADAIALRDSNDGFFNGNGDGMGILFLFFLLAAFSGGGWEGWGNGNGNFNQVTNDFLFTNLRADMNAGFADVSRGLQDVTRNQQNIEKGLFDIRLQGCNDTNVLGRQIDQARFDNQNCCCETNRNIDSVRYENKSNTCDIINAIHADGEATRSLMVQNTIQELRDNLQAAQLQLGNINQTQNIVNQLRPCPIPAYITCSPYEARSDWRFGWNGFSGCGCNNGCGC